jgi:cell division protease FtsH
VHKITIIPRGMALGYTMSVPDEDKFLVSRSAMIDDLAVFLGGRVAEELFCGDITTGASNDLERATKQARQMVVNYGMSDRLGHQTFGQPNHEVFLGRDYGNTKDYSEETAKRIDDEVARLMKQAHDRAAKILSEHRDQIKLMASVLLDRETVDGDACQALLDNKWSEYLAHEQSAEGKAERERAATTLAHPEDVPQSMGGTKPDEVSGQGQGGTPGAPAGVQQAPAVGNSAQPGQPGQGQAGQPGQPGGDGGNPPAGPQGRA